MRRLGRCHVIVCGMGGVGSWAAEALARSAVGRLTLIDFDKVSLTTINRQLPGSQASIGRPKVDVMAERVRAINPTIEVMPVVQRINPETIPELFKTEAPPDYVIDAIDQLGNKCALIVHCFRNNIPIVTSSGAGGRLDPTRVRIADLAETEIDPLARMVRVYLRRKYDFPSRGTFGIPAVFSPEVPRESIEPEHPEAEKSRLEVTDDADELAAKLGDKKISDMRNVIMGTACFVTSVFGMACASHVVRDLLAKDQP